MIKRAWSAFWDWRFRRAIRRRHGNDDLPGWFVAMAIFVQFAPVGACAHHRAIRTIDTTEERCEYAMNHATTAERLHEIREACDRQLDQGPR